MKNSLICAQATARIRSLINRQKEAKTIKRYRVNIRPEIEGALIINHSFFVEATCTQEALTHPRVQQTCLSLSQLGYQAKINIVPFPIMDTLNENESSNL